MPRTIYTLFLLIILGSPLPAFCQSIFVITDSTNHYLPENSLPAIAIAIAQGAKTIQFELAMTRDGQILLLKDTTLNNITNAADLYPEKTRQDGTVQSLDFSFAEIQQLSLRSSSPVQEDVNTANTIPSPQVHIPTLSETLGLIRIMEQQLGYQIGIVAEIKKSWLHRHEKQDISSEVLTTFKQHGFINRDNIYIASYDPEELQRIKNTLLPEMGVQMNILQLFDTNDGTETMRLERGKWQPYNYDWLLTTFGLKSLSSFADSIGFSPDMVISTAGELKLTKYTEDAHMLGLTLFAYPFDAFTDPLPVFVENIEGFAEYCLFTGGLDGLITGEDNKIRKHLEKRLSTETTPGKRPKTSIEKLLEEIKQQNETP